MARFMGALKRVAPWAVQNADVAIALLLAVVVGVLGILPEDMYGPDGAKVQTQLVSAATLVILALVATALLRDRARQAPMEAATTCRDRSSTPRRRRWPCGSSPPT